MTSSRRLASSPRRAPLLPALVALVLVGGLAGSVFAKGKDKGDQVVVQFLVNSGEDADGTARAKWTDKGEDELQFSVELEQLPAGDYDLYVTDFVTPKGVISVDGSGEGELEFESPLDDPKPLFDFEVFGQQMEVRQGATVFFSDTFTSDGPGSGSGGTGDKTKTKINLVNVNTAADFNAQGRLEYESKTSKVKFKVVVEKLDPGIYTILLDGQPVGELETLNADEVELEFQSPVEPGKTLLNFDPLGKQVDISKDGVVTLSAVLPGAGSVTGTKAPTSGKKAAKDLGKTKGDELQVFLLNSGFQAGAQGQATLTQTASTAALHVTIEDVPAGDYSLFVDGVDVGVLSAGPTGTALLDFNTSPGAGESLLDFTVKGQLIEVVSGSDVLLSVVFPMSVQAALGSFKKETFKFNKVKVNLLNNGLDLDVTGTVLWTLKGNGDQEVRIDVRDLPAGDYGVVVNGTPSATPLTVTDKPPYGKAKLVFATVAKGSKVLLDFDPVDATLQITDSNDQVLLQAVIDVP